jgi:serine/threonine protein kinase
LLALAGSRLQAPKAVPRLRALTFADLKDPVLGAFFASRPPEVHRDAREFATNAGPWIAVERPLEAPQGLGWRLAALSEEAELSAPARRHARAALISSSSFVLGSVLFSSLLAFGISRLRQARRKAERRVQSALERVRELGSYQLERRIGSGGMGEVWRARHRLLARPAAIKLIRTERLGQNRAGMEARFEQEARVLSSLRSPNTVSVFDFGRTTDGRLFLVMELLEGLTLDRVLALDGRLPAARVIELLIGVCRSLAEAHAAGLVHRDVKPANLFLCHEGDGVERIKVIDFGLVKAPPSDGPQLSRQGGVSGTPDYMAPEQASGAAVDGRTDLYALGCTAFHLLTGKPVFSEPSDVALLLAHRLQTPPSPAKSTPDYVPRELDQLVVRCLAKEPECRPSSAASLGRALGAIELPREHRLSAQDLSAWWQRVEAKEAHPGSQNAGSPAPA